MVEGVAESEAEEDLDEEEEEEEKPEEGEKDEKEEVEEQEVEEEKEEETEEDIKQRFVAELGLPMGWAVETRVRKSGQQAGSTYKHYLGPHGQRARSLTELNKLI